MYNLLVLNVGNYLKMKTQSMPNKLLAFSGKYQFAVPGLKNPRSLIGAYHLG